MAERAAVHARVNRLLRSEVTSLSLGLYIEGFMIYVRHL